MSWFAKLFDLNLSYPLKFPEHINMRAIYFIILLFAAACKIKHGKEYVSQKSRYVYETLVIDSSGKFRIKLHTDLNTLNSEISGSVTKFKNKYRLSQNWVLDTFTVYEYIESNLIHRNDFAIDTSNIALSRNNKISNGIEVAQSLTFSLVGQSTVQVGKQNKKILLFKDSIIGIEVKVIDSVLATEWIVLKPGKVLRFIDLELNRYMPQYLKAIGPKAIRVKSKFIGSDKQFYKRIIKTKYRILDGCRN